MSARLVKVVREQAEAVPKGERKIMVMTEARHFNGLLTKTDFSAGVLELELSNLERGPRVLVDMEKIVAIEPQWQVPA